MAFSPEMHLPNIFPALWCSCSGRLAGARFARWFTARAVDKGWQGGWPGPFAGRPRPPYSHPSCARAARICSQIYYVDAADKVRPSSSAAGHTVGRSRDFCSRSSSPTSCAPPSRACALARAASASPPRLGGEEGGWKAWVALSYRLAVSSLCCISWEM